MFLNTSIYSRLWHAFLPPDTELDSIVGPVLPELEYRKGLGLPIGQLFPVSFPVFKVPILLGVKLTF